MAGVEQIWWFFLLVPLFALLLCVNALKPIRNRVRLRLAVATDAAAPASDRSDRLRWSVGALYRLADTSGWAVNKAATVLIDGRRDLVSSLGALTIGILGSVYGRAFKSASAYDTSIIGTLILVPGGIAAAVRRFTFCRFADRAGRPHRRRRWRQWRLVRGPINDAATDAAADTRAASPSPRACSRWRSASPSASSSRRSACGRGASAIARVAHSKASRSSASVHDDAFI